MALVRCLKLANGQLAPHDPAADTVVADYVSCDTLTNRTTAILTIDGLGFFSGRWLMPVGWYTQTWASNKTTVSIGNGKKVILPAQSANCTVYVSRTSAKQGDVITLTRAVSTYTATIYDGDDPGTVNLGVIGASLGGFMEVYFNGTSWQFIRGGTRN
jgi:hypothetical protein